MNKTHWKKLTNPNYLGSYAFQPGEEKTVTLKEVKREVVQNQNGKEECTVAYFEEDVKPLILNKTNCDMISKVWGTPYLEDWTGKGLEEIIICEVCGKAIMPAAGKTAKEIATATKIKYNKAMCVECARKESNNG